MEMQTEKSLWAQCQLYDGDYVLQVRFVEKYEGKYIDGEFHLKHRKIESHY